MGFVLTSCPTAFQFTGSSPVVAGMNRWFSLQNTAPDVTSHLFYAAVLARSMGHGRTLSVGWLPPFFWGVVGKPHSIKEYRSIHVDPRGVAWTQILRFFDRREEAQAERKGSEVR